MKNTTIKTFKEVIAICGDNFMPTVTLDDGDEISASCWTDEEDVLAWPATFDIHTSWDFGTVGPIGRFDNSHGELDNAIEALAKKIADKVGGTWIYDAADCVFKQI